MAAPDALVEPPQADRTPAPRPAPVTAPAAQSTSRRLSALSRPSLIGACDASSAGSPTDSGWARIRSWSSLGTARRFVGGDVF